MKNIFLYLILLIPWFFSSLLFNSSIAFFDRINLPFFALPKSLYGIAWTILYMLIAYSTFLIFKYYKPKEIKSYSVSLIINYLFNQLFLFSFFYLENTFLGFINTVAILLSSLFLYIETKDIDNKASKYLKPYIIFNIYAFILSMTIYFMNL